MSEQQIAFPAIDLKPIVSYPREAQAGETYLMTIDVQLGRPGETWPYPEEEYPISFILDTQPYFSYEPLDGHERSVVLHCFGGTYGPVQYVLTATEQAVEPGYIYVTLINGGGLPIGHLELECAIKQAAQAGTKRKITLPAQTKQAPAPETPTTPERKQPITLSGHSGPVNACAISPDGSFIVSASSDKTLRLWDTTAKEVRRILVGHTYRVNSCAVSPDSRFIISASVHNILQLWDATTGEMRHTFTGHTASVNSCAVSPDGTWIVSASHDHTLKVWKVATGEILQTFTGHTASVTSCAVSPDGTWIVSGSHDRTLKVWDTATGAERFTLSGHRGLVQDCMVSSDGRFIISASADRSLKVWEAATGVERFTLSGHTGPVNSCAMSSDGNFIVSASADRSLKVWEAATGVERFTLSGHTRYVNSCAVSPDSSFIVSASDDGTLKVWDVAERVRDFAPVQPAISSLIERQLIQAGWIVQDATAMNIGLAQGIAIREFPLSPGRTDYLLVIDGEAIGVIENKEGTDFPRSAQSIEDQLWQYQNAQPTIPSSIRFQRRPLPFAYGVAGNEIQFTNHLEPDARTRSVFHFHRPETFAFWLNQAPVGTPNDLNDLLRSRLRRMPPLEDERLPNQEVFHALLELEKSLRANHPRTLIQMTTGAGKTATLVHMAYRLFYYTSTLRILYLVNNYASCQEVYDKLGQLGISDAASVFIDRFNMQILQSNSIDSNVNIYISTAKQFDLIFSQPQIQMKKVQKVAEIQYNPALPVEFVDVILIDDCDPETYRQWCPLLEYFDAFVIGATSVVDQQMRGFFNGNLVYESNTADVILRRFYKYFDAMRDSVPYHNYIEQLTYLLFLKMADENGKAPYNKQPFIPTGYDWPSLLDKSNGALEAHYTQTLLRLSNESGTLGIIFQNALNKIHNPEALKQLILDINEETWIALNPESLGEAYNSLLERNTMNKKGGLALYITPQTLTQTIVEVMQPQAEMRICDPACGTGGFLVTAYKYVANQKQPRLNRENIQQIQGDFISGWEADEIVSKIGAMNLFVHGIAAETKFSLIRTGDSLLGMHISELFDMVLCDPPFGRKYNARYEESRAGWGISTRNAELAYIQLTYALLKPGGRAAIVAPNNVLSREGAGEDIRRSLLETCDFHTLLLLPENTFYYTGISSVVLFFDKLLSSEHPGTQELWIYDLRTNMHFTRRNPLRRKDFDDFVRCYNPANRHNRQETARFRRFSYEELLAREGCNFDISWPIDES